MSESEWDNEYMTVEAALRIRIAELEAELARLAAEQALVPNLAGWRTIESAPKDGTSIFTYIPTGNYQGVMVNHWHDGYWYESSRASKPSHWMPLPAPPAEETT